MGCYCILRSYSVLSFWLVVVQQWYSKFYLKGYMPWFECASQRRLIAINKRKAFDHYLGKHYEALKIIAAKCAMLSYTVDPIIHAYVLLCSDFGGYVIIRSGWVNLFTHILQVTSMALGKPVLFWRIRLQSTCTNKKGHNKALTEYIILELYCMIHMLHSCGPFH